MYENNAHGDTIGLAESTGSVIKDYKHDAFGNLTAEYGTGAETSFRYNGQYTDDETCLIYLRNRYYDPSIGRFTQEDTYWNVNNMVYGDSNSNVPSYPAIAQSSNLYVYCMSDPVNSVDPWGNEVTDEDRANLDSFWLWSLELADSNYEYASNNEDLIGMSKAHAEAVRIRKMYNPNYYDDYDYTYNGRITTYYYSIDGVSGNIYIARGDDSVWIDRQTVGYNDYLIVDYTNRGGVYIDNPRMQIRDSYKADSEAVRYEIIDILLVYESNYPSDWTRSDRDSLQFEWFYHNAGFWGSGTFSSHARHADLDNNGGR